jgi:iron(III) transport system permease protein
MIAAKSVGWSSAIRRPAFSHGGWRISAAVLGTVAVASAFLAVAPIASLVVIAAADTGDLWAHLARYVIPVAVLQTALLLAGVAGVTVVIGVGTAWAVTTFDFPGRRALTWLLPLPLAIPTYIVAYIYADMLGSFGPVQTALRAMFGWQTAAEYWFPQVRSLGGAIFVMGIVLYPYVYLAARAMFQTQGAQYTEAARVLGASPWRLAFDVSLPLARPAIAVGVALALLETLNDIGASEYLGVQTLTLSIFATWLNRGSLAGAAQIACMMLVLVAALIALERYGQRGRVFAALTHQGARFTSLIPLTGRARWVAAFSCYIPVVFGFLLPTGFLLLEAIVQVGRAGIDPGLLRHALTTIALAAMATAVVLAVGFMAVAATRYLRSGFVNASVNVAGIGYAIPGTVLALGMLSPLVLVDEGINALLRAIGGSGAGLLLAGSMAAVIVAYVIRFLAIALGFAQAGFARVSTEFDDVARMLGASPAVLARTIHLPLVRPAIWGAGLLVFVDCLKELPATLLLRPLNVETLSTYIYQFATRGSFEEGALAALIIVAVGIPAVVFVARYSNIRRVVKGWR